MDDPTVDLVGLKKAQDSSISFEFFQIVAKFDFE